MNKSIFSLVTLVSFLFLTGCDPVSPTSDTESNLKEKTIELNTKSNITSTNESMMVRNKYFFLDEVYRLKYLAQFADSTAYKKYLNRQGWEESPVIKTVEIYRRYPGSVTPENSDKEFSWAQIEYDSEVTTSLFEKLIENIDYSVDKKSGRIIFYRPISKYDHLALYLEDESGEWVKGDKTLSYHEELNISIIANLWLLKIDHHITDHNDSTYHLMLRNVYPLNSAAKLPNFSVKRFVRSGNSYDYSEKTAYGTYFAQVLGLMDENENYLFQNKDIFDLENGYVLIPPYKKSDNNSLNYNDTVALQPFTNRDLWWTMGENNWGSFIYDDRNDASDWFDRFELSTINEEKQTCFTLDFNIVPESEIIKTEGTILERELDYFIDYDMGYVELLSERAKSATIIKTQYQLD